MVILDTNIFIYIANGTLERTIIANTDIACASVSIIEALGYSQIEAKEQLILRAILEETYTFHLNDVVIEKAITLKQLNKMSLGDSIIAATALCYGLELWTTNVKDFDHIDELKIINPFKLKR